MSFVSGFMTMEVGFHVILVLILFVGWVFSDYAFRNKEKMDPDKKNNVRLLLDVFPGFYGFIYFVYFYIFLEFSLFPLVLYPLFGFLLSLGFLKRDFIIFKPKDSLFFEDDELELELEED